MNNNTLKLNMSEMEQVNGTGLIDWITIKVGLPLARGRLKPAPANHKDYEPFKDDDCFI